MISPPTCSVTPTEAHHALCNFQTLDGLVLPIDGSKRQYVLQAPIQDQGNDRDQAKTATTKDIERDERCDSTAVATSARIP